MHQSSDVSDQVERYFAWVEEELGTALHRSDADLALRPRADIDGKRHNRRGTLLAAAAAVVAALLGSIVSSGRSLTIRTADEPDTTSTAPSIIGAVTVVTLGVTRLAEAETSDVYAPTPDDDLRFTADGSTVVALRASAITVVDVIDVIDTSASGRSLAVSSQVSPSLLATVSPDGQMILFDGKLIDTATGAVRHDLTRAAAPFRGGFNDNGSRVVVPSNERVGEGQATVFDTVSGEPLLTLSTADVAITSARFSPDGSRIITYGELGVSRVWDAESGVLLGVIDDSSSESTLGPDGSTVLTVGGSGRVKIRDATTGQVRGFDRSFGDDRSPRAWFDPTSRWVVSAAAGSDGDADEVSVWDEQGGRVAVLPPMLPGIEVGEGAFSADGSRLVAISADGVGEVWSTATFERVTTFSSPEPGLVAVTISADGRRVAGLSTGGDVTIWELT